MSGEHERKRSEPSFSDEGIDRMGNQEPGAQVDLDQLLNEIGKSMASASSGTARQHHDRKEDEGDTSSSSGIYPSIMTSPEQSALDFGEFEQASADDRFGQSGELNSDNDLFREEEPMSRGVLMAGGALVALSLLSGVVGLFVAFGASGKIEALQQSVDALQTKMSTMQVSGDPRVGQLQAEQAGLASRIDELAMKMESQAATPAKGEQLADLRKRLDALEHKSSQPAKSPATIAVATPKSITTKPVASSGDWTVILVSFTSSAQADSERGRLQKLGLRAEVFKSVVDGKTWFRVRMPGYPSQESAKAAIPALEAKSGINGAWVAHR